MTVPRISAWLQSFAEIVKLWFRQLGTELLRITMQDACRVQDSVRYITHRRKSSGGEQYPERHLLVGKRKLFHRIGWIYPSCGGGYETDFRIWHES